MATACVLARLNLQQLVFRTLSQRAFAKKKKKKRWSVERLYVLEAFPGFDFTEVC